MKQFQTPDDTGDEQTLAKVKALDIGCGAGILSESLGRLGLKSVHGIDPTPKCIELANEHLTQMVKIDESLRNVTYEQITLEDLMERSKDSDN